MRGPDHAALATLRPSGIATRALTTDDRDPGPDCLGLPRSGFQAAAEMSPLIPSPGEIAAAGLSLAASEVASDATKSNPAIPAVRQSLLAWAERGDAATTGAKGPPGIARRPLDLARLAQVPGPPRARTSAARRCPAGIPRVPRNDGVDPTRALRQSRWCRAVGDPSRLMVNSPAFYRKITGRGILPTTQRRNPRRQRRPHRHSPRQARPSPIRHKRPVAHTGFSRFTRPCVPFPPR
jgi:hypothetical protein